MADGLTLLLSTTYMDEAERCGRVGLMHQGKLLRIDTPARLKESVAADCYAVEVPDPRAERARLEGHPLVAAARPSGSSVHVFLRPGADASAVWDKDIPVARILPSLEDVFVAAVESWI